MLYVLEYWAVENNIEQKMGVVEMRILRWLCGVNRNNRYYERIRN